MMNSSGDSVTYTLPQSPRNRGWTLLMNTYDLDNPFGEKSLDGMLEVAGRSVVVLRELAENETKRPNSEQAEIPAEDAPRESVPATEELLVEALPVGP
jgi:hypothetical protein